MFRIEYVVQSEERETKKMEAVSLLLKSSFSNGMNCDDRFTLKCQHSFWMPAEKRFIFNLGFNAIPIHQKRVDIFRTYLI